MIASVKIPEHEYQELKRIAKANDLSISQIIRKGTREYVKKL